MMYAAKDGESKAVANNYVVVNGTTKQVINTYVVANGQIKSISRRYLYRSGNEFKGFTDGWKFPNNDATGHTGYFDQRVWTGIVADRTKQSDSIKLRLYQDNPYSSWFYCTASSYPENQIDFSKYTNLHVKLRGTLQNGTVNIGLYTINPNGANWQLYKKRYILDQMECDIDITDITDTLYLNLYLLTGAYNSICDCTVELLEMWLK